MPLELQFSPELKEVLSQEIRMIYADMLEEAKESSKIEKEYLSINEVLKLYDLSRNTLTNNFIERGLPVYVIERKQYIKRSEMNAFIDKHKI